MDVYVDTILLCAAKSQQVLWAKTLTITTPRPFRGYFYVTVVCGCIFTYIYNFVLKICKMFVRRFEIARLDVPKTLSMVGLACLWWYINVEDFFRHNNTVEFSVPEMLICINGVFSVVFRRFEGRDVVQGSSIYVSLVKKYIWRSFQEYFIHFDLKIGFNFFNMNFFPVALIFFTLTLF